MDAPNFMQTHEIQSAINAAEPLIDHTAGRGLCVQIYQHELAVLIAAANECIQKRIDEEEARLLRDGL